MRTASEDREPTKAPDQKLAATDQRICLSLFVFQRGIDKPTQKDKRWGKGLETTSPMEGAWASS